MENTSLQKMIFRIDYEANFEFMDRKGKIADLVRSSKLFDRVLIRTDGLGVGGANDSPYYKIDFFVTNINGTFEGSKLEINKCLEVAKLINSIFKQFDLLTADIARIGARFLYLSQVSEFKFANIKTVSLVSNGFKKIFTGELFDSSIILKIKNDDQNLRLHFGPLSRDEHKMFFDKSDLIEFDSSLLVDLDYYFEKYEYKDLRLDKFIEDGYNSTREYFEKISRHVLSGD